MCLYCDDPRHLITFDAMSAQSIWLRARKVERAYSGQLRKIARHVGDIVTGHGITEQGAAQAQISLARYADTISDWARSVAWRIISEINQRDREAWMRHSRDMGSALRREITEAPTGATMRRQLEEQVVLIKSLPLEAAKRIQNLAVEGVIQGRRFESIADEIKKTYHVTDSRARLIARTETGRVSTGLTEARALYVGSLEYGWHTVEDTDVRPSHREMQGRTVRWDSPPKLDGMTGHAGTFPNCRCWPEPILPEQ